MTIILDTNFLIYCSKNKLDYVEEIGNLINKGFELVVPMQVVEELKKLRDDKWKKVSEKDKDAVVLALQILNKNLKEKKIRIIKTKENADKAIKKIAEKQDVVATMDKELKKKLKGKVRILSIRQRKKLEII